MSTIFLAVTLLLWSIDVLGWVSVSIKLVAVLALITAILLLVEGFGVYRLNLPNVRH